MASIWILGIAAQLSLYNLCVLQARVRKALLMMLHHAFKANPPKKQMAFMLKHDLYSIVGRMADTEAAQGIVIVATVANKLQVDFNKCIATVVE